MKRVWILLILVVGLVACDKDKSDNTASGNNTTSSSNPSNNPPDINNTYGFGILSKIRGIWNGPVTSTTPLGGYPEWIVDFRPVSENQISAKNELDTLNDIHMSFFVALYNNQYKVAFRNGGSFAGNKRVSYFLADSVSETGAQSFYRFAEIIKGRSRAYTEVIFKSDSLYIKSYTNRYNTLPAATPHMVWSARLQDTTSCQAAVNAFGFPKKTLTKDFSSSFTGQTEAVYFNTTNEPYPETAQPYLGQTNVTCTYAPGFTPVAGKREMIIITTQPLFSGFTFTAANLRYRSRYVILSAPDTDYTFNYMHPGTYYLYALYDHDGNGTFNSGDWVSTANTVFTLHPLGTSSVSVQINFTIP